MTYVKLTKILLSIMRRSFVVSMRGVPQKWVVDVVEGCLAYMAHRWWRSNLRQREENRRIVDQKKLMKKAFIPKFCDLPIICAPNRQKT